MWAFFRIHRGSSSSRLVALGWVADGQRGVGRYTEGHCFPVIFHFVLVICCFESWWNKFSCIFWIVRHSFWIVWALEPLKCRIELFGFCSSLSSSWMSAGTRFWFLTVVPLCPVVVEGYCIVWTQLYNYWVLVRYQ